MVGRESIDPWPLSGIAPSAASGASTARCAPSSRRRALSTPRRMALVSHPRSFAPSSHAPVIVTVRSGSVLFLVVFASMLVEARRAASNERAQLARGGLEPPDD